MSIETKRSLKNKEKATTQVLFKRTGATNVVDLGNIIKFAHAPDLQRVEHFTAAVGDAGGGYAMADGKLISTVANRYTLTCDEIDHDMLRLLNLTDAATASNQSANASLAVTIADVEPGNSYDLGSRGITAHALTFAGDAAVEGTDFSIDYAAGILKILSGGAIVSGDDVAGTINVPAITRKVATSLTDMRATGSVVILQWDQFSEGAPRREIAVSSVELYVTNWGESTHTGFREVQLEINCLVKPVSKERTDS